jgi:hypothetical protein
MKASKISKDCCSTEKLVLQQLKQTCTRGIIMAGTKRNCIATTMAITMVRKKAGTG